jgi:imidazolonepropionase-like amidohydrolase
MKKVFLLFLVLLSLAKIQAQDAGSIAITNAKIITVSGSTIENGTVVIRNGLIEAVGENIKVPADSILIDGKNLTVYPGFFDTNTSIGIPATPRPTPSPQALIQQASQQQQSSSRYPSGLRPEIDVIEQLKADESLFETQRNNGITTVVTVLRDGIFNGQSAVINLAGSNVAEMIIKAPFAQHITFRTLSGGIYPTSLLGTFSAIRQMFLDAKRLKEWKALYESNPSGMQRPESDRSLEALFPAIEGKMPVVFYANTEREIIRALDLAKELNLKAIIAGGHEAWKVTERLKAQDVPVLLSLNFPKRTAAASEEADPESLETLRFRAETLKCAGRLEKAGVRFAFQSGGIQNYSDIWTNLNKAIENGLSKEAAIKSLTITAAQILGVDNRLGSIEKGKIANLVISKGDLFSKERNITHVIIDGKLFEIKQPQSIQQQSGSQPKPSEQNVSGTWAITIEAPGQTIPGTLVLTQEGTNLTGSFQTALTGSSTIKSGRITGEGFSFSLDITLAEATFSVTVTGKVSGNQISGTIQTPQGTFSFSGTKNP